MARPLRYEAAGAVYHVMARGEGVKVVFEEAAYLECPHSEGIGLTPDCGELDRQMDSLQTRSHMRNSVSLLRHKITACLCLSGLFLLLSSCLPTSSAPLMNEGQRACVLYNPYKSTDDVASNERLIRASIKVRMADGQEYTIRPYDSLRVPIPQGGTTIEALPSFSSGLVVSRRREIAEVPPGSGTVYVRVKRTEGNSRVQSNPVGGIPMAIPRFVLDSAEVIDSRVARLEISEFE